MPSRRSDASATCADVLGAAGERRCCVPSASMSKPNLVAITTWSRTGASASPTSSSLTNGPIDLGGVEEGDAALDRVADERDHLVVVAGRPAAVAHAHAAEAEGRDLRPLRPSSRLFIVFLAEVGLRWGAPSQHPRTPAGEALSWGYQQGLPHPAGLRTVGAMNPKDDIRGLPRHPPGARLTPEQAGLPVYGANRRVAGLRREEVALLAGISVEYYTRLERGNVGGVSDSVLEGVAHALQLDEAERDHLYRLVRTPRDPAPAPYDAEPQAGPPDHAADARPDADAGLPAQRALRRPRRQRPRPGALQPALRAVAGTPNSARFLFLDPAAPEFFVDFDEGRRTTRVAFLRAEAGRDPYDKELGDLIGELSTRSERFRRALGRATTCATTAPAPSELHHPIVGDLTLDFEALDLPGDEGQRLNVYTAEPGRPTAEALGLLASWSLSDRVEPGRA